jgi:small acid-soluble spore protein K (minor)
MSNNTIYKGYFIIRISPIYVKGGVFLKKSEMYSKQKHNNKFDGEPKAKERFASKRPDGSINTHPQERMHASSRTDQ